MAAATAISEIRGDTLYTYDAIKAFGLGTAALRSARRQGLVTRTIGRKKFILGRDLIAFVERTDSLKSGGSVDA